MDDYEENKEEVPLENQPTEKVIKKPMSRKRRCLAAFIRTWTPQPTIDRTFCMFLAFGEFPNLI